MLGKAMLDGAVGRGFVVVCLAGLLAGFVGCSKNDDASDTGMGRSTGSEFDQGDRVGTVVEDSETVVMVDQDVDLRPVYFGFDLYDLTPEARGILRDDANQIMESNAGVVIEGHTDSRGTEEYNLALGDRRAYAVKKYIGTLGVPDSRMRTVSYGEAVPAVRGNDESAWRWNRRVNFRIAN